MGKNIKDFKSWNTVSEAGTWGEWMQSLVTGAKAEAPELDADTKSAIANVKDLAGKAADKISDIFGIDNKDDKDAKIKPGKSFKSTDGKIPEEYVAALEAAMDRHGITNDFARKAIPSPAIADF